MPTGGVTVGWVDGWVFGCRIFWTSSVVLPTGGVVVGYVPGWVLGWLILRTFSRVVSGWTGPPVDWISFGVGDFEDALCRGRYEPESPRESCPRVDRLWGRWVLGWGVLMTFSKVASGWTGSLVDWINCGVEDFKDAQCRGRYEPKSSCEVWSTSGVDSG